MSARREYVLEPNRRWRAERPQLASSEYGDEVLYRESPVTRDAPVRSERGAPGRDGAGLSQRHSLTVLDSKVPDATRQPAQVEIWEGGTLVRIQREHSDRPGTGGGKRGKVLNFSAQSRRNMLTLLNQLQKEALPQFITLTLPGKTQVSAEQLNAAFHRLRMAFKRTFPGCSAVWKKELADRKSGEFKGEWLPHYHLLAWSLPHHKFPFREYRGKWVNVKQTADGWRIRIRFLMDGQLTETEHTEPSMEIDGSSRQDRLTDWLSRMWYEFVGSGEGTHLNAGTSVEMILFATGVKRYAAKYLGKEQFGARNEYALGRYWGVWNKECLPWASRVVYHCTERQAVRLMRVVRRYFEKKAKRRARLGHVALKIFINDSSDWLRLVHFTMNC